MKRKCLRLVAGLGFVALLCGPSTTWAQVAPPLGGMQRFGVLGNSGVTGAAGAGVVVNGDVGSSPTATITNFPPSSAVPPFTVHLTNDGVVQQAHTDAIAAYNALQIQGSGTVLPDNLATVGALTPGIYSFVTGAPDLPASATLTLNGAGIFVFNVGSSLTANVLSNVVGTADPCNIYWRVGSSAVLNGTNFRGTVIANTSITVGAGANLAGRAVAGTGASGAVTMAGAGGNTIGGCSPSLILPPPPPICLEIVISPPTLPLMTIGVPYSQTLTASRGTAPYTFSVVSGTLPAGLTLTAGGVLSGTPTTVGSSTVTIRATDTNGCFGEITYTLPCVPTGTQPTITSIPNQVVAVSGTVAVPFTIGGGVITDALVVTVTSSDLTLVPQSSLVVTKGSGGARVLTVSPAQGRTGVAAITITVTDPTSLCPLLTATTFQITVGAAPVPTLPQWAMIALTALLALTGFAAVRRRRT